MEICQTWCTPCSEHCTLLQRYLCQDCNSTLSFSNTCFEVRILLQMQSRFFLSGLRYSLILLHLFTLGFFSIASSSVILPLLSRRLLAVSEPEWSLAGFSQPSPPTNSNAQSGFSHFFIRWIQIQMDSDGFRFSHPSAPTNSDAQSGFSHPVLIRWIEMDSDSAKLCYQPKCSKRMSIPSLPKNWREKMQTADAVTLICKKKLPFICLSLPDRIGSVWLCPL